MNFLTVTLTEKHGTLLATSGDETFDLGPDAIADHPQLASYLGRTAVLGMRPEALRLTGASPTDQTIRGRAELVELLRSEVLVHASTAALSAGAATGQDKLAGSAGALLIARSGVGYQPAVGQEIKLSPDPANLHFFDPTSGQAI